MLIHYEPLITVIITTIGANYVRRAIKSVKEQIYSNIEIVICYDGNDFLKFKKEIDIEFPYLKILNVGPFNNANNARQSGIEISNGEYIALLDDDDYWSNDHILNLIKEALKYSNKYILLASSTVKVNGSCEEIKLPEIYFDKNKESLASYLFLDRKERTLLQTSSLFFTRLTGIDFPFDRKLKLHQDYDWTIKLNEKNVKILQIKKYTSFYVVSSNAESISKKSKAIDSFYWFKEILSNYSNDIKYGFLKKNTIWFLTKSNFKDAILFFLMVKRDGSIDSKYLIYLIFNYLIMSIKIFLRNNFNRLFK